MNKFQIWYSDKVPSVNCLTIKSYGGKMTNDNIKKVSEYRPLQRITTWRWKGTGEDKLSSVYIQISIPIHFDRYLMEGFGARVVRWPLTSRWGRPVGQEGKNPFCVTILKNSAIRRRKPTSGVWWVWWALPQSHAGWRRAVPPDPADPPAPST